MNHNYQTEDFNLFNYKMYNFEQWILRGPKPNLSKPYICCLGAAQTFGRYCENPFVSKIAKYLNLEVVNFGIAGADPCFFLNNKILNLTNLSMLTIIQIMSARSCSNSLFKNTSGCREGFAYGQNTTSDDFWMKSIRELDVNHVQNLIKESRNSYLKIMLNLLNQIKVPRLLLWTSTRKPEYSCNSQDYHQLSGGFPHFVNEKMINDLLSKADDYVQSSSNDGMPQKISRDITNFYYPSPQMHDLTFQLLKKSNLIYKLKHRKITYA